jgi:hypothetical protein
MDIHNIEVEGSKLFSHITDGADLFFGELRNIASKL